MNKLTVGIFIILGSVIFTFSQCSENKSNEEGDKKDSTVVSNAKFGGYESQVKWGAHLVTIGGCNDCHTPKKMGPNGPENNMRFGIVRASFANAGTKSRPQRFRKQRIVLTTNGLTEWIGPWGISYAANLTPDSTGIGGWKEDQFIYALRHGKWMGLTDARNDFTTYAMAGNRSNV